jgi:hypothetical protein
VLSEADLDRPQDLDEEDVGPAPEGLLVCRRGGEEEEVGVDCRGHEGKSARY